MLLSALCFCFCHNHAELRSLNIQFVGAHALANVAVLSLCFDFDEDLARNSFSFLQAIQEHILLPNDMVFGVQSPIEAFSYVSLRSLRTDKNKHMQEQKIYSVHGTDVHSRTRNIGFLGGQQSISVMD